jgi:hypothetical protein
LPRAPVFDEARGHDEGCLGNPKPLVVDDAGVAAEAAPTQKWASVGGLLPRAPAFDGARGHGEGCSGNPEPLVVDDAEFAAEAAPTKKWASVGGLRSEHPSSMRQGVTMKAAPATLSLWLSMTPGSRLKPLLPKNGLLWGGLLLRAPVFDEARGHGGGCSGSPEPLVLDDAEFAAEAAPTKKWASVGGAFAPNLCLRGQEDPGMAAPAPRISGRGAGWGAPARIRGKATSPPGRAAPGWP